MKKLYFALLLFIGFNLSFSQSVEIMWSSDTSVDISGTEIETVGADSDIAIYADLKVVNKTGSDMNMSFLRRRVINSGQADQICDNQGCFNATDTYEWSTSPVEILDGDTSLFKPQVVPNGNDFCGLHVYYVIDDQGTVYDSVTIKIRTSKENCFLDIDDEKKNDLNFDFYPNPAKNNLTIETPSKGKAIFIDALGKNIEESELNVGENQVNISTLKNGVYFVNIVSSDGVRGKPMKLIIQK